MFSIAVLNLKIIMPEKKGNVSMIKAKWNKDDNELGQADVIS